MTPAHVHRPLLPILRASDLPFAFVCPGSVREPVVPVKEHFESADVGSAAHEILRVLAEGGGIAWDDIPAVAARFNVDEKELRVLVSLGLRLWSAVRDQFPDAVTEVGLAHELEPGLTLSGHIDILSVLQRVARIGDWKTGRLDHDYKHQMMCYATLVLLDDPSITEVVFSILWVREGDVEPYRCTRQDAQAWLDRLRQHVIEWDGVYRPGPHCIYCRSSHECAAANALARRDAAVILGKGEGMVDLAGMSADEKLLLYQQAKMFAGLADRIIKTIKEEVLVRGDLVSETEGKLTTTNDSRREVVIPKAIPILLKEFNFTPEDMERVTEMSAGEIDKVVAEKAGRGYGAEAVRKLQKRMEEAGAVTRTTFKKLTLKR